jgi:ketosteroid isomerase-like protein
VSGAFADAGLPPGTTAETLVYVQGAKAFSERGVEGLAENWHDDVVYEEDPLWPGAGSHRGRDAAVARLHEYEEQLGQGSVSVERIVEGSRGVVVIFSHSGVTPASGVPFEHRWAWLIQARDGKAAHIRAYFDPDEALRAAEPGTSD